MTVPGRYVPLGPTSWKSGDYRHAASLKRGTRTIEQLAAQIGAEIEDFVEDGWGRGQLFGAISPEGRQIAIDYYLDGVEGPNLLVLFEGGKCSRSEVLAALSFFHVAPEEVYWITPETADA